MTNSTQTPNQSNTAAKSDATANDRFAAARAARQRDMAARELRKESTERERPEDLGGLQLKLAVVGEVPGHHMYWENDEDGKIEQLLYDGFDFVSTGEVRRGSDLVADLDVTDRISRYVGRRNDGSPLRAYLMKCPDEIWKQRQARGQYQADTWDEEIRKGRMAPQGPTQYTPKGVSSSLKTNSEIK